MFPGLPPAHPIQGSKNPVNPAVRSHSRAHLACEPEDAGDPSAKSRGNVEKFGLNPAHFLQVQFQAGWKIEIGLPGGHHQKCGPARGERADIQHPSLQEFHLILGNPHLHPAESGNLMGVRRNFCIITMDNGSAGGVPGFCDA